MGYWVHFSEMAINVGTGVYCKLGEQFQNAQIIKRNLDRTFSDPELSLHWSVFVAFRFRCH